MLDGHGASAPRRTRPAAPVLLAASLGLAGVGLSPSLADAATASATVGGAGLKRAVAPRATKRAHTVAATKRTAKRRAGAKATTPPAPALAPVAGVDGLDAGVALRRLGRGVTSATIGYVSHAPGQSDVRIDVVRRADGMSVFSNEQTVAAEQPQTVTWDGRADGALALDGRYDVRISAAPATAVEPMTRALDATPSATLGGAAPEGAPPPPGSVRLQSFTFVGDAFPVQGPHTFNMSAGRFGAGRAGHTHEGQDVMARCGLPVVAARGGVVQAKGYDGNGGNYVVISDPLTGRGYAYMHFRAPALVGRGETVQTGELIGVVGETGDATACHLHFEIWTAPGWYTGGHPIDPLASLKAWDKHS
jgi:murein DD-endopeptidase MepM/ murein hydrolase activator NlpD